MVFCNCCKKEVEKLVESTLLNRTVYLCESCYELVLSFFDLLYGESIGTGENR